jgi:hypothetical protein
MSVAGVHCVGEIFSRSAHMGIETREATKPSCQAGAEADEPCMLPATEYCEQCGSWFCHTHFSDGNCSYIPKLRYRHFPAKPLLLAHFFHIDRLPVPVKRQRHTVLLNATPQQTPLLRLLRKNLAPV